MLILPRGIDESVLIEAPASQSYASMKIFFDQHRSGGNTRLGFEGPRSIRLTRTELLPPDRSRRAMLIQRLLQRWGIQLHFPPAPHAQVVYVELVAADPQEIVLGVAAPAGVVLGNPEYVPEDSTKGGARHAAAAAIA